MKLVDYMAKSCFYAQDNVNDREAWETDDISREKYFTCVSYQVSCFLAQNTILGDGGVDSTIVLNELIEYPMKSQTKWKSIIEKLVKDFGGLKNNA